MLFYSFYKSWKTDPGVITATHGERKRVSHHASTCLYAMPTAMNQANPEDFWTTEYFFKIQLQKSYNLLYSYVVYPDDDWNV